VQRRLALAVGLLALLAALSGCSAAGSIELQSVNDSELASEASRAVDPGDPGTEVTNRSRAAVVSAAVANGSTTVDGLRPPIEDGLPFVVDGAYYDLSRSVVGERAAHVVDVGINYEDAAANGTAVDYAALPAPDRAALDRLLPRPDGFDSGDTIGVGVVYSDADLNASALVPTQQYDAVRFEGERYALHVDPPRAETVFTYRYAASMVAPNASAYAAHLDETYAFALTGLSDAERSVVESALDDAYYAESTDDEGFAALVERFRARDAIAADDGEGTWLVRYGGERYLADLSYAAFVD